MDMWSVPELNRLKNLWALHLDREVTDLDKSFVSYGGKSIKYMELISKISREWKLNINEIPFSINDSIMDHYRYICENTGAGLEAITHREDTMFKVSAFAEKMLIDSVKSDDSQLHMPFLIKLDPSIDKKDFVVILNSIVSKHRILRSSISVESTGVYYRVYDDVTLDVEDIVIETAPDKELMKSLITRFDIARAPLLHAKFVTSKDSTNYVFLDFCHLIIDGPSIMLIAQEIVSGLLGMSDTSCSKADYFDYIEWYKDNSGCDLEFWKNELQGGTGNMDLPFVMTEEQDSDIVSSDIDPEFRLAFEKTANECGVTCFTLMLALYSMYLHRATAENDLCVGIPISCRNHPEAIEEPGMYVNTVIYRSRYEGGSAGDYINKAGIKVDDILKHKDAMLQDVLDSLDSEMSSRPFDTMFVYQDYSPSNNNNEFFSEEPLYLNNAQSLIDIRIIHTSENMSMLVSYDDRRMGMRSVRCFLDGFIAFCNNVILEHSMDKKISEMPLQSPESEKLVRRFEGTVGEVKFECLSDIFTDTAHRFPDKIAVDHKDQKLTYAELNRISNRMARELGFRGRRILIVCNDPITIAVSILGVMKSGNVYLPVSDKTSLERIRDIVSECDINLYISREKIEGIDAEHFAVDYKAWNSPCDDVTGLNGLDDIAYIIYTSGTTGKSKGVEVYHKGVSNGVKGRIDTLGLNDSSNSIQLMGYAFDGFVQTFFSSLLCGATLHLVSDICDFSYIKEILETRDVRTFLTTPTMYGTLLSLGGNTLLKNIGLVALAGEALDRSLIEHSMEIYPDLRIANEYGPTENSIVSTINPDVRYSKTVSIGKPISNCRIRIADKYGRICPVGFVGEMLLSGVGLAKGYINDSKLTDDKFRIVDGERWYKTGDHVAWLPDGDIIFKGRIDSQIKLNGYRVDLCEIERMLLQTGMFEQCTVAYSENKELTAYYVAPSTVSLEKVVPMIRERLEYYMIPSEFYKVSYIPVKDSGKIDTRILDRLIVKEGTTDKEVVAFAEKLAVFFGQVLEIENYGIDRSFFSSGGNSIKAMVLLDSLKKNLDVDIDVDMFRVFNSPVKLAGSMLFKDTEEQDTDVIKPFNTFWFGNCFYTSILAVLDYYDMPLESFINKFALCPIDPAGRYHIKYDPLDRVEALLDSLGLDFRCNVRTNDFLDEMKRVLKANDPVIAHVDCFYLPYCQDKYQTEHHYHVVTLVEYDSVTDMFRIIDQQDLQSISFEYKTISSQYLITAMDAAACKRDVFHDSDYVVFTGHAAGEKTGTYRYVWKEVIGSAVEYMKVRSDYDELNVCSGVLNHLKMERYIALKSSDEKTAEQLKKLLGMIQRRVMKIVSSGDTKIGGKDLLSMLTEINVD